VLAAVCWRVQCSMPWRSVVESAANTRKNAKGLAVLCMGESHAETSDVGVGAFAFSVRESAVLAAVCWSAQHGVPWRGIVEPGEREDHESIGCSLYGRAMLRHRFLVWEQFACSVRGRVQCCLWWSVDGARHTLEGHCGCSSSSKGEKIAKALAVQGLCGSLSDNLEESVQCVLRMGGEPSNCFCMGEKCKSECFKGCCEFSNEEMLSLSVVFSLM
jgi:hypothetical protein